MFWKPCFWPSNMEIKTVSCSWCWTAEFYLERCMNCHPNTFRVLQSTCIREKKRLSVSPCVHVCVDFELLLSPAEAWLKDWHTLFHKHNAAPCGVTEGPHVSKMEIETVSCSCCSTAKLSLKVSCMAVRLVSRSDGGSSKRTSPSITVRSVPSWSSSAALSL